MTHHSDRWARSISALAATPRLWVCLLLAVGSIFGQTPRAWAQPRLDYQGPSECPGQEETVRAFASRFAGQPPQVDDRVVVMRADRDPHDPELFQLQISLRGPLGSGLRRLTGRDCVTLVNAGVVVAALALGGSQEPDPAGQSRDDEAARSLPDPAARSAESAETPTAQAEEPPEGEGGSQQPESRGRPGSIHLGGWLAGRLSVGALPTPAPGLALGMTLKSARFRGEIAFLWLPWSAGAGPQGESGPGGEFAFYGAELRLCGDVVEQPIALGLCAGIELGAIQAQGVRVDVARSQTAVWLAPEAGAVLVWPFTRSGRLALRVEGSILVPVLRPIFYVVASGDVHQPAPVAGRFGIGLRVNFF